VIYYVIFAYRYRLAKSIASVDYEIARNNELKTNGGEMIEFDPEFQKIIDDVNSQIEQLDASEKRAD